MAKKKQKTEFQKIAKRELRRAIRKPKVGFNAYRKCMAEKLAPSRGNPDSSGVMTIRGKFQTASVACGGHARKDIIVGDKKQVKTLLTAAGYQRYKSNVRQGYVPTP